MKFKNPFIKETLKSYPWFLLLLVVSSLILVLKNIFQVGALISNSLMITYLVGLYFFTKNILSKKIFGQADTGFFKFNLMHNLLIYSGFSLMYCAFYFIFDRHLIKVITLPIIFGGLAGAFFTALYEEILFRHILLSNFIYYKTSPILPILVSSLIFGFLHFDSVSTHVEAYILYTFLMGCFMGLFYWIYKNIWLNITIHFVVNSYNNVIDINCNDWELELDLISPFSYYQVLPIVLIGITLFINRKKLHSIFIVKKI